MGQLKDGLTTAHSCLSANIENRAVQALFLLTFAKINISTYGLSHIFYCYLGHTLLMCGFHFCLDPRFKYTYIHTWRAISTLQLWWNYKSIMGYVLHHSWSAEFAQPNCKCFHWLKHYNINTLKLIWKLILEINYSYKNHI